MSFVEFNAQRENGGWIVYSEDAQGNGRRRIVVKDTEVVKQFKEFVEQSKAQLLVE